MKTETYHTYDALYNAIPLEGSLGVLALGAAGIAVWRKKRQAAGLPRAASFQPAPEREEAGTGRGEET